MTGNPDLPGPDATSSSHSALNYYGELVRRQWEGCLPEIYQQIRDPGAYFAVLGEVIAHRIDELADHLAGDDQHGEGYLAKVARLTAAREHALERVLSEYLLLPPAPDRGAASGWTTRTTTSRPQTRTGGDRGSRPPVVGDGRCRAAGTARRSAP